MAITNDRFRVYDSPLNLVHGYRTKADALTVAGLRESRTLQMHYVEDRMAQAGKPNRWDSKGNVIGRKETI